MSVTLLTIDCPKCKILEKKLDAAGVGYAKCYDKDLMVEMGIDTLPVLLVDGEKMQFKEAVDWVNERS